MNNFEQENAYLDPNSYEQTSKISRKFEESKERDIQTKKKYNFKETEEEKEEPINIKQNDLNNFATDFYGGQIDDDMF